MSQTVVGIEKIKDFDTARALDSLGTTLSNIATAYSGGVNQIQLTGTATTVVPTIAVGGSSVDTNIGIQLKGHGTGSVYIGGTGTTAASSAEFAATTSAVNHLVVTPAATGNPAILSVGGSGADANAALLITALASGTGAVYIGGAGALASAGLQVTKTSSAVNQLVVTPAATGNAVQVYIGGASVDANPALSIQSHGTGAIHIGGTGVTDSSVQVATVASAVNKIVMTPTATGSAPIVSIGGSGADANRSIQLKGNGTGGGQLVDGAGAVKVDTDTTGVGFFATAPVAKQAITGALSTVADAPAKAVLTSIIAALVAYGLASDGTT